MDGSQPKLEDLMSRFPSLSFVEDGKKIKCGLTGHEMPPKMEVIKVYVTGKKFLKLHQQQKYDYLQHRPHLVDHEDEKHRNQLYCNLTHRFVNKVPEHVERHVKGKRYQRELKRYQDCVSKGINYTSRRKPQNTKKEKDSKATKKTDQEQLEMDFIPTDSEDEEGNESDGNLDDLYPEDDFTEADDVQPAASEDNQSTKEENLNKKTTPRVNSSKSKRMRQRKFPSSLHKTRGIKQRQKVTKRSKPQRHQAEKK